VPVALAPPVTEDGATVRPVRVGGVTVTVEVNEALPTAAVTVTEVLDETGFAVNVKVAVVAPAGIVTVAGTEPAALLDERLTTQPPTGAAVAIVTVPVAVRPSATVVGVMDTPVRTGVLTVRLAEAVFGEVPAVIEP